MRAFNPDHIPLPKTEFTFDHTKSYSAVDLEIGSGVGQFAIRRALENFDRALIGVERTHERFAKFLRRKQHHGSLANLFPLHADAVSVVTHLIPSASLDEIFILYPNPYPKAKQRNLRWYNSSFTKVLLDKLKPEGFLTLATNMDYYHEEALEMMKEVWHLRVKEDRLIKPDERARTPFERKYLLRDELCWNMKFQKD